MDRPRLEPPTDPRCPANVAGHEPVDFRPFKVQKFDGTQTVPIDTPFRFLGVAEVRFCKHCGLRYWQPRERRG